MESGDVSDDQITASSFFAGQGGLNAWKGRLNNADYWATSSGSPADPWIQVDLSRDIDVKGIITQGSAHVYMEWVTELQIQYGDSEDSLEYILENNQPKVAFSSFFPHFSNMMFNRHTYQCNENSVVPKNRVSHHPQRYIE